MGYHLATQLSYDNKDIILIDTDREVLDYVLPARCIDSGKAMHTSFAKSCQRAMSMKQVCLAVTNSEKTNIVLATSGKALGKRDV